MPDNDGYISFGSRCISYSWLLCDGKDTAITFQLGLYLPALCNWLPHKYYACLFDKMMLACESDEVDSIFFSYGSPY